ncbi:MAG TPA: 3-hydroxyacyl-CoA dehydrogenase family protein [Gemmatimonadota bacterium]|nr:3-hydroxyacyl-CoA dehydrogenase family protein [Gemmatimonadota bacterium]
MSVEELNVVAVIGAGTMGRGIAQAFAQGGYATTLYDVDPDAAHRALEAIEETLDKGVARGKVSTEARDAALERLRVESDLGEAVMDADLAIESIPELLDAKREMFAELDTRCPERAILASNTSSLPIATLAAETGRPTRVAGLHFFNPVHAMKLVEIVAPEATGHDVVETLRAAVESLGKRPIVVRDVPGFATSRLGLTLGLEAIRMVEEEVASPADIDTAMELGYNHPMGPLKLTDLVGLDVRLSIAEHLARELDERRFAPPALLREMVAAGKLGRKTGEGFYLWRDGTPIPREAT